MLAHLSLRAKIFGAVLVASFIPLLVLVVLFTHGFTGDPRLVPQPAERRLVVVITALIALGLSVALAWFGSRRIVRPLDQIIGTVHAIASGKIQEIPTVRSGDELEDLSASLRSMVAALSEQREQLNFIVAHVQCLIWQAIVTLCDPADERYVWDLQVVDVDAARRVLPIAIRPGETFDAAWMRSIAPEDRSRIDEVSYSALARGSPRYTHEFRCQIANGEIRWLREDVSVEAIEPRRWQLVGVCTDITDRHLTEEALARVVRQNRLILLSAEEGIFGLDAEGRITFVNPAASRMFGAETENLLGEVLHDAIGHTDADAHPYPASTCPICTSLRDGTSHRASDDLFWRQDGSSFSVEYACTPIREADEVVGAVVTFRDVTERKQAELELRQAQKLESVGRLASGIAHEINTPIQFVGDNTRFLQDSFRQVLNVVDRYRGLREDLEQGRPISPEMLDDIARAEDEADLAYLNEEIPKSLVQTLEGVQRVSTIVRAMKDFAHPDNRDQAPADLNAALLSTLTVARNELKYVADVVTDLQSLPPVRCYVGELNQVFLNLMINAAHAITDAGRSERGQIRVRTALEGERVVIQISDNGCGIPDAIQHRIFDPFFTTKEVGRGTGQGLTLARSVIVDKHKGSLSFESKVGQGTTFTIVLPVAGCVTRTASAA